MKKFNEFTEINEAKAAKAPTSHHVTKLYRLNQINPKRYGKEYRNAYAAHADSEEKAADRMWNRGGKYLETKEEVEHLNEVSQKLALAVANKRTKQGSAHRLAQSKVDPNVSAGDNRLFKSLGNRADTLYSKAKKSYEYAFGKGVAKGEKLAKEEVEQIEESFMSTYNRNENANRHTANIVHLAKHYGDKDDQAKAEFYAKELKKHGHNIHHEAQYEIHKKLWPHAVAHAKLMKEDVQINELKKSTLKSYIDKAYPSLHHHEYDANYGPKKQTRRLVGNRKAGIKRAWMKGSSGIAMSEASGENEKKLKSFVPQWKAADKAHQVKLAALKRKQKSIPIFTKESEQVDELNKSTLKSYIKKSYGDIGHQSGMVAHLKVKKYKSPLLQKSTADQLKVHTRKEKNRGEGIDRAVTQLTKEEISESVKGRIAFRRLFPAKSQKRFETKFPDGKSTANTAPVKEGVQLDEMMTRKHFQQVADVIKAHPDAANREELAKHHASIFKASNPRFDHKRFYAAANVNIKEDAMSPEHLNYIFAKAEHPKEFAASKVKKPKLKKLKWSQGGADAGSKQALKSLKESTAPKYQVGQTVTPKIGPHSGIKHTVIHVHPDGAYNIKPNVHSSLNKYRLGAARAQEKDLE